MKTIQSKQGTLQGRDFKNGAWIAVAVAAVYPVVKFLIGWISEGNSIFDVDIKTLVNAAVAGLLAYLGKNLVEPSKVGVITEEGKEARGIIASRNDKGNPPPVGDPTHPKG